MEKANQLSNSTNSSSTFTTELFGPKHSSSTTTSSSSSGIFVSVFGPTPNFKKDGGKDDYSNGNNSNSASRGNWWEGSLYY